MSSVCLQLLHLRPFSCRGVQPFFSHPGLRFLCEATLPLTAPGVLFRAPLFVPGVLSRALFAASAVLSRAPSTVLGVLSTPPDALSRALFAASAVLSRVPLPPSRVPSGAS